MDMPTFSGLDLSMTWDPELLKPIRVSPEPWLIESNKKIMDSFVITANRLSIIDLKADSPPWRMIIGKFHFKVLEEGDAIIKIKQGDQVLDDLKITFRKREEKLKNEKEAIDFDL